MGSRQEGGRYIALNVYIRKEEKPQSNYLSFHLKKLEKKKEQINYNVNRRKETIKIRLEIADIQHEKSVTPKADSSRRSIKLVN